MCSLALKFMLFLLPMSLLPFLLLPQSCKQPFPNLQSLLKEVILRLGPQAAVSTGGLT